MKRDSGISIATAGTVFLAGMCCIGLPLIAAAIAAVGAGALYGGLGAACVVAFIVGAVGLTRYRLRRRGGG